MNFPEKLIRAGVKLAREAAKDKFVALDLGPVGKLMEPAGPMTFDEAYDIFAHAVEAGKEGADLILLETMTGSLRTESRPCWRRGSTAISP